MKNVDKSLMWLRIICAAVWLAVFLMIGCLYSNITKQKVTIQTPLEKEIEKEYEEPKKIVITSMLEKSMSICKEEQATDRHLSSALVIKVIPFKGLGTSDK